MKKTFIESSEFTKEICQLLNDEGYASLQRLLMERPEVGKVMSGCGGLRKLRIPDLRRGKGKRGGARIIYLHVPEANWIFFLDVYDKSEKDDLSAAEKKVLRELAVHFKEEAFKSAQRQRGNGR